MITFAILARAVAAIVGVARFAPDLLALVFADEIRSRPFYGFDPVYPDERPHDSSVKHFTHDGTEAAGTIHGEGSTRG